MTGRGIVSFKQLAGWMLIAVAAVLCQSALADPAGDPRIPPAHDAIARLQQRIDRGDANLNFDTKHGYLASVLKELKIPASSQSLVFSKTSFQRELISPHKPRAIYFNDDVYIGWVRDGSVLEVASMDPKQGTVFYTLKQQQTLRPKFARQTNDCLQCHESGMTQGVAGLLMRSVYPDEDGMPILSAGTSVTTDQTPLRQRWGGWYVTGTHGGMRHMGNVILADEDHPDQLDFNYGANLIDLRQRIKTAPYLAPTSDIVALMVLAHQTNVHNLMSKAAAEVTLALSDQRAMNLALKEKPDHRSQSTQHRIQSACEPLVKALLFSGEAKLTGELKGTCEFAREFESRGPADASGRSLRQLDLTHRLFKYPCSYLIYSDQFNGLPHEAKSYVYRRLGEVLSGRDSGDAFGHLTAADRTAIAGILSQTKNDLPIDWLSASTSR